MILILGKTIPDRAVPQASGPKLILTGRPIRSQVRARSQHCGQSPRALCHWCNQSPTGHAVAHVCPTALLSRSLRREATASHPIAQLSSLLSSPLITRYGLPMPLLFSTAALLLHLREAAAIKIPSIGAAEEEPPPSC
jgi:hypothetical protein